MPDISSDIKNKPEKGWQWLAQLNRRAEIPLIILSVIWVILVGIELVSGLPPFLDVVTYIIWFIFILDFVAEWILAPDKKHYLHSHTLTLASLILPALRIFRIFRFIRMLRSLRLLKLLASFGRGFRIVKDEFKKRGAGYVFALTAIVILLGAAGMAFFESPQAVSSATPTTQVSGLSSYGDALWWTAMIITTIGSEYWPVTPEGRILGFLIALYAFSVFGYITATLTSLLLGRKEELDAGNLELKEEIYAIKQELVKLRQSLAKNKAQ